MSVEHYENFPVASILCPPALRPAITAIYHFARTADDLADEGDAAPAQRLADLAAYRHDLQAVFDGGAVSPRWPQVFEPLRRAVLAHALPQQLLADLLDAFEQDVSVHAYRDRAELLDYCRRSANPIGRLLLHLYGIADAQALRRSDAICSALQLANFWQDFGIDTRRGRCYLPETDRRSHPGDVPAQLEAVCAWTRELMGSGAPLVHAVPGRAGWELRLVVQGGLRILDKIAALGHDTRTQRPTLTALDAPRLLWRAARMRRDASSAAAHRVAS